MAKRIIALSDGTGNSSAKAQKTNVWRMFQAIDQSRGEQLVIYDNGVGTSSNKLLAALGGAIGWGLKRNVIELYKFICRNYRDGDDLFGFGFSRGAFTIRTLIDFIAREGLVAYRSEEELDSNARRAYASYRSSCFKPTLPGLSPVSYFRIMRKGVVRVLDWALQRKPVAKAVPAEQMRIRFVGVWDTVSAYGMPFEEFRPLVNFLFWPMLWDDLKLSRKVERACHALALDDERTTFHPIVWDEGHEEDLIKDNKVAPNRLSQVWFSGMHSNLGGGYPEDQLSLVSLDWMMSQAKEAGLHFLDHHLARISEDKSHYARLYDSRRGLGRYYRYAPRVINTYPRRAKPILPVVHHSVLMRMALGSDGYAPLPLPAQFHVLAPDGTLVDVPAAAVPDTVRQGPYSPQILQKSGVADRMKLLKEAIEVLQHPDQRSIELAWDTVWWRRLNYFVTLLLTFALLSLPWSAKLGDRLVDSRFDDAARGSVKSIFGRLIESVQPLIPAFLERWSDAARAVPFSFLALAAAWGVSMFISSLLSSRIRDRIQFAWHFGAKEYPQWLLDHAVSVQRASLVALLAAFAGFVWSLANSIPPTENNSGTFGLVVVTLVVGLAAANAWSRASSIRRQLLDHKSPAMLPETLPSTWALSVARHLRTNNLLVSAYRLLAKVGMPVLWGVILVSAIVFGANRVLFDVVSASGAYCKSSTPLKAPPVANIRFATSDICNGTGMLLKKEHVYRITLTAPNGVLFDDKIPADLGGFAGSGIHVWSRPLLRWWSEDWFTPVARVGQFGDEEYPLHPAVPFGPSAKERSQLVAYITPDEDGELFLYVNDAVSVLPNPFYSNNRGAIDVQVDDVVPAPGPVATQAND